MPSKLIDAPPSQGIDQQLLPSPIVAEKYLWMLIFSVSYFIPIYYMPGTWLDKLIPLGLYAIFVWLYINICRYLKQHQDDRLWLPLLGLNFLVLIGTPFTPGTYMFFIYIGFFLGYTYSPRVILLSVAIELLYIAGLCVLYPVETVFFWIPAILSLIPLSIWGYFEQLRIHAENQQRKSHREIEYLAAIAERERIARDLHDLLGHSLSSIALKAELAEKLLTRNELANAQQQVIELKEIARESLHLVRQTVSGYKHKGLLGELIQLTQSLRDAEIQVTTDCAQVTLTPKTEFALILSLTELTTNILRHSKATQVSIQLQQDDQQVWLIVKDNGKGYNGRLGNGIKGIHERIAALSGTFTLTNNDGVQAKIGIPFKATYQ